MNIQTFVGDQSLLAQEIKKQVESHTKEHGTLSIERIQASEASYEQLLASVSISSLFASPKLVIIDDISTNADAIARIDDLISATSDSASVIFREPNIDRRSRGFNILKQNTTFNDFKPLIGSALETHLKELAARHSLSIQAADLKYLIHITGEDLARAESEILKLAAHGSASRDDIDLLVDKQLTSKVFDLLEAAMNKKSVQVRQLYQDQRALGVEPQAILGLIVWQMNMLTLAKLSTNLETTAKEAKVSTYPLRKAASLASGMSFAEIKSLIALAAGTDLSIKTGADADDAAQLLLLNLAT